MLRIGRLINNLIILALILVLYFKTFFDYSKISFLSLGSFNLSLPLSGTILLIAVLAILIFFFQFLRGLWLPLLVAVLSALLLQNWLVGVSLGVLHLIFHYTIGRIG